MFRTTDINDNYAIVIMIMNRKINQHLLTIRVMIRILGPGAESNSSRSIFDAAPVIMPLSELIYQGIEFWWWLQHWTAIVDQCHLNKYKQH